MQHPLLRQCRSFARQHKAYCWFSVEFAIVCGAAYSVPGLITAATSALAAGNIWLTLSEYLVAPVYAGLLFVSITGLITMLLVVPPAVLFGQVTAQPKPKAKAVARVAKTATTKTSTSRLRRKAA